MLTFATPRRSGVRTSAAWEWQATGTTWRIHHDGCVSSAVADSAAAFVEADESVWSRFRPTSDIARINDAAGSSVVVSPETRALVVEARIWKRRTQGVFDPLIGNALRRAGYVASFEHGPVWEAGRTETVGSISVDDAACTVAIPAGSSLDLGGIAKGWMADRLATFLRERISTGAVLVDAGGDLVAARETHLVGVEGDSDTLLALPEGSGVATSGWQTRSWRGAGGSDAHHLIDPATGSPGVRSIATVVAESGTAADVLAKVIALRPGSLRSIPTPARVTIEGVTHTNEFWQTA